MRLLWRQGRRPLPEVRQALRRAPHPGQARGPRLSAAPRASPAFPGQAQHWWQAGLLAAVYFAAAKLSLAFAIPPGYATAVWPPSGIALAAALLLGARVWPGVWVGAALVNVTVEASWLAAATIATGNTLEALAGAALVRRAMGVPYRFERGEDVVKFMVIAAASSTIAASVALLPLSYGHALSAGQMFWNWWTWWQGDLSGILIVTPLVLGWCGRSDTAWTPAKRIEALVLLLLLLLTARVAFGELHGFSFEFVILPFIIWAAFRFGQREVVTVIAAACALAVWYTLEIGAPAAPANANEALLVLLAFNNVVVLTGLVLSAVLGERARAGLELRRRHDELEARVHARTRELEKANRAKSEFLAKMSHELRTPLNSLLILAALLRDNVERNLTPKQVQYAKTIHDAGSDLLALINEILDLARIESGAPLALELGPVRIADLQGYLEHTFRHVAQEEGLAFSVTAEGAPESLRTDARRLQQILRNLLANAFKFTRHGAVALRITTAASGWPPGHAQLDQAEQVVAFAVSDSGIGVPRDQQDLVFEAFQQAGGSSGAQYGGTGLGLSISRELARLLGGELCVVSEPGRGSTFTLFLPLRAAPFAA
ncbi:MAG: MASE1 domain-containing protein [Betaproteobacteria bacterium]|nr:MASE1 domain-containing protein [Betaproteobacteria bacterium]